MVIEYLPTLTIRTPRVSIQDKKRSWTDGFAAAVRDEEFLVQYAIHQESYKNGWDAGEAWRERNGLEAR